MAPRNRREQITAKLIEFYRRHDPSRTPRSLEPLVNYAMTEGIDKLNGQLINKYGDSISLGTTQGAGAVDQDDDRTEVRHKLELFYLKHDPRKLDKPEDIESVVEWAMIYGINDLNRRLKGKYNEELYQVTQEDAIDQIQQYYSNLKIAKRRKDFLALVEWGMLNSFSALSKRLLKKYGKSLGQMDSKGQIEEVFNKLKGFFSVYAPQVLEDEENMMFMTKWTIKFGEDKLNARLQKKYGANLLTVRKPVAQKPPEEPAEEPESEPEVEETPLELPEEEEDEEEDVEDEEHSEDTAEQQVQIDEERMKRLALIAQFYLAKHDEDRFYNGGVQEITAMLRTEGEEAVDEALFEQYGERFTAIIEQHDDLEERLTFFYRIYDEEKLEKPIATMIGWAIVQGEDALNEKLLEKYDEDLVGTGLTARLRKFYAFVGETRTEKEIKAIVDYALRKGLKKLNKKLKGKYGKCLEDMFITDEIVDENSAFPADNTTADGFTDILPKKESYHSFGADTYKDANVDGFSSVVRPDSYSQPPKLQSHKTTEDRVKSYQRASPTMIELPEEQFEEERKKSSEFRRKSSHEVLFDEIPLPGESSLKNLHIPRNSELDRLATRNVMEVEVHRKSNRVPKVTELERLATRNVMEVETERQKQESSSIQQRIELNFKREEEEEGPPVRVQRQRKSLKMIRQRRGSTTSVLAKQQAPDSPAQTMQSKLYRFLDHVDEFRAREQGQNNRTSRASADQPRKTKSGGFSYSMTDLREEDEAFERRSKFTRKAKNQEKKAADNLMARLKEFYQKHDKKKAKLKSVMKDVEFVLKNGIDAMNKKLLTQYGESLNSVDLSKRMQSMKDVTKPRRTRAPPRRNMRMTKQEITDLDELT